MDPRPPTAEALLEKIRGLSPDKIAEVADFVDFLRQRTQDDQLVSTMSGLSENAFAKVWDNPDDAAYDEL